MGQVCHDKDKEKEGEKEEEIIKDKKEEMGIMVTYKFIISFSIFNFLGLWRTLCLQSNIEEVLSFSFSIPIYYLWF